MWIFVNSSWVKLGIFEPKAVKQWVHTCLKYNRSEGIIEASVDGKDTKTLSAPSSGSVENFNITFGKTYKYFNDFFGGLVTNLNMFNYNNSVDLRTMSANPCLYPGDFFSWADMTWLKEGDAPREIDLDEEEVCGEEEFYNLALPSEHKWKEANRICTFVGDGKVPEIENTEELQKIVEASSSCKFIWTPYSDEEEENTFVSLYTGLPMPSLPWKPGNPNLGTGANAVQIHVASQVLTKQGFKVEKKG